MVDGTITQNMIRSP